jgi:phosphoglycolate phosphatase
VKMLCRAVVFDWDGTLVNTLPRKINNAGQVFKKLKNFEASSVESAYRNHSGIPRRQLFDVISVELGGEAIPDEEYEELSKAFSVLNKKTIRREQIFPKVITTLETLKDRGFKLFVSSSAEPDDVNYAAQITGLKDLFIEILGSKGEFKKGKIHIAYIFEKYGIDIKDICVVGDEHADIKLSKEAGVRVVAKIGTLTKDELFEDYPNAIISDLSDLLDILAFKKSLAT